MAINDTDAKEIVSILRELRLNYVAQLRAELGLEPIGINAIGIATPSS